MGQRRILRFAMMLAVVVLIAPLFAGCDDGKSKGKDKNETPETTVTTFAQDVVDKLNVSAPNLSFTIQTALDTYNITAPMNNPTQITTTNRGQDNAFNGHMKVYGEYFCFESTGSTEWQKIWATPGKKYWQNDNEQNEWSSDMQHYVFEYYYQYFYGSGIGRQISVAFGAIMDFKTQFTKSGDAWVMETTESLPIDNLSLTTAVTARVDVTTSGMIITTKRSRGTNQSVDASTYGALIDEYTSTITLTWGGQSNLASQIPAEVLELMS